MKQVFCGILFSASVILLIGCQNENSNSNSSSGGDDPIEERPLTEEELKEQLHETECTDRSKYIDGTLGYQPIYKNLLSMKVTGMKLTFDLTNTATLAKFKDIDIEVSFLSKTGAVVLKEEVTIYEYLGPGDSITDLKEVNCTNQQYQDISEVSWIVLDASCD